MLFRSVDNPCNSFWAVVMVTFPLKGRFPGLPLPTLGEGGALPQRFPSGRLIDETSLLRKRQPQIVNFNSGIGPHPAGGATLVAALPAPLQTFCRARKIIPQVSVIWDDPHRV